MGILVVQVVHPSADNLEWKAPRRLKEMRAGLHHPIKQLMGSRYEDFFKFTPFARSGRPMGTTARLDAWCKTLSEVTNKGAFRPYVVAMILEFLEGDNRKP